MTLGPFLLTPLLVPKPWGGRRLAEFGKDLPPDENIGESWDVADLDPRATSVADPVTRVATGPFTGVTLHDLIVAHGSDLLGDARPAPGDRFPLLIKLLDARESLSVQVHPPAGYVAAHRDAHLKTESWVVIDAEPGAELLLGLVDGATMSDIAATAGTAAMLPLLRRVPARPGDVHHLPAGMIHALGAGVVVAEVQTPSDTTYRLYDWVDEYGRAPRALQIDAALECLALEWATNVSPPASPPGGDGLLLQTPHYALARQHLSAGDVRVSPEGQARIAVVLDGTVRVEQLSTTLGRGRVAMLPAVWRGAIAAEAAATVLLISP